MAVVDIVDNSQQAAIFKCQLTEGGVVGEPGQCATHVFAGYFEQVVIPGAAVVDEVEITETGEIGRVRAALLKGGAGHVNGASGHGAEGAPGCEVKGIGDGDVGGVVGDVEMPGAGVIVLVATHA